MAVPSTANRAFRNGSSTPSTYADFGQCADPINSYSQGSGGSNFAGAGAPERLGFGTSAAAGFCRLRIHFAAQSPRATMGGLWLSNAAMRGLARQMSFGARLAEERKRLGMKQAEFAARVGTNVPKQSLYENGRRELRADYLARLADADVDIVYVLTGRRGESSRLGPGPSDMLGCYFALPPELQQALEKLARSLCAHLQPPSPPKPSIAPEIAARRSHSMARRPSPG